MSYCDYWNNASDINKEYHDSEWGVPVYDDKVQFEYLMLEVLQCGLSWNTVINKRKIFRKCFDKFDYDLIAKYSSDDIERIMNTEGMIKSSRKIEAIINNARCFQKIREEFGSFSNYLWKYTDNKTILYNNHELGYIPACNGLSDIISKDLKKRGFKFLGSVTVYSHLQACGVINDHGKECPRYKFINSNYKTVKMPNFSEKNVITP